MEELRKAKDKAINKIVRAWGVPDQVKMYFVNKVLDSDTFEQVRAARKRVRVIQEAYGELAAVEIEFNINILI